MKRVTSACYPSRLLPKGYTIGFLYDGQKEDLIIFTQRYYGLYSASVFMFRFNNKEAFSNLLASQTFFCQLLVCFLSYLVIFLC